MIGSHENPLAGGQPARPIETDVHKAQLDGLRFLAFLGVFAIHTWYSFEYGRYGVPLFFAISGFLITRILVLHESDSLWQDLRVFYVRRFLRIFPLFYGVLLVLCFLGLLPHPSWQFLYVQNFLAFRQGKDIFPPHFWSLCVEEQFYLTYPLLFLATPRAYRLLVLCLLFLAGLGSRVLLASWFPNNYMWHQLPLACAESLSAGCLAGLLDVRFRKRRVSGSALFCVGVLLLVWCFWGEGTLAQLDLAFLKDTLIAVSFALIVFGLWNSASKWLVFAFSFPALAYLGRISYGLYVYHYFAIRSVIYFHAKVPIRGLWRVLPLVSFVVTVIISALSWHYFELPINKLKRRFPYFEKGNPLSLA
jgi:peptidoglycan/LPS O-acetylase OafA/YrhL